MIEIVEKAEKRDIKKCKKCNREIKKSQILKLYESEKIRVRCNCGAENFYYFEWDEKGIKEVKKEVKEK